MKIALLAGGMPGASGSAATAATLARAFAVAVHSVHMVTRAGHGGGGSHQVRGRVWIHRLQSVAVEHGEARSAGSLAAMAAAHVARLCRGPGLDVVECCDATIASVLLLARAIGQVPVPVVVSLERAAAGMDAAELLLPLASRVLVPDEATTEPRDPARVAARRIAVYAEVAAAGRLDAGRGLAAWRAIRDRTARLGPEALRLVPIGAQSKEHAA